MGEAKRRKSADSPTFKHAVTGEELSGRWAPSPSSVIKEYTRSLRTELLTGGGGVSVPCNGCTACCRDKDDIEVRPREESPDAIEVLQLREENGKFFLPKAADGSCAHLIDSGCSVRSHRPLACRVYDCRLLSLCGVLPNRTRTPEPIWEFRYSSLDDKAIAFCMKWFATEEIKRAHDNGEEWFPWPVALKSLGRLNQDEKSYRQARELVRHVSKLTEEQRREMAPEALQQFREFYSKYSGS